MRKLVGTIAAFAFAVLLAGCASSFKSEVARFHQLPRPSGESFVIVPKDPAKQGSLEFAQYAGQISNHLSALGYKALAGGGTPDLVVSVDYTIDEGKVAVRSTPSAFGAYGYGWRHPWYGPYWGHPAYFGYPGYGYPGYGEPEIRSYVIYTRKLSMDIERAGAGKGARLFEGRVESQGTDNRLPEVMPYMIEAMFADFPGHSGQTQVVKIPYEKTNNY